MFVCVTWTKSVTRRKAKVPVSTGSASLLSSTSSASRCIFDCRTLIATSPSQQIHGFFENKCVSILSEACVVGSDVNIDLNSNSDL